jgi:hypothetical protein
MEPTFSLHCDTHLPYFTEAEWSSPVEPFIVIDHPLSAQMIVSGGSKKTLRKKIKKTEPLSPSRKIPKTEKLKALKKLFGGKSRTNGRKVIDIAHTLMHDIIRNGISHEEKIDIANNNKMVNCKTPGDDLIVISEGGSDDCSKINTNNKSGTENKEGVSSTHYWSLGPSMQNESNCCEIEATQNDLTEAESMELMVFARTESSVSNVHDVVEHSARYDFTMGGNQTLRNIIEGESDIVHPARAQIRIGANYQAMIPTLKIERRPCNLMETWNPERACMKDVNVFLKKMKSFTGLEWISESRALGLLADQNYELQAAIQKTQQIGSKSMRNLLQLKGKNRELSRLGARKFARF